jgi:hypothetical protein
VTFSAYWCTLRVYQCKDLKLLVEERYLKSKG